MIKATSIPSNSPNSYVFFTKVLKFVYGGREFRPNSQQEQKNCFQGAVSGTSSFPVEIFSLPSRPNSMILLLEMIDQTRNLPNPNSWLAVYPPILHYCIAPFACLLSRHTLGQRGRVATRPVDKSVTLSVSKPVSPKIVVSQ
jgi:hypothetical protein